MLLINPGAASAAMNAGSAAKAETWFWTPDAGHIKGSRKKRVTGLAGKARHQGSPQGFGPHHAIIRKGLDRGSCGSRGHSRQSRHITAPDLAAQQGNAQRASVLQRIQQVARIRRHAGGTTRWQPVGKIVRYRRRFARGLMGYPILPTIPVHRRKY